MQLCVLRVTALVHERLRRFVSDADPHELLLLGMRFSEMGTQPALTIVDVLHAVPPVEIGLVMGVVMQDSGAWLARSNSTRFSS